MTGDWYDSVNMRVQMASAFRNQIHDAVLIPGITATEFINQFMTSYNQLAENVNHTVDPAQDKDTISENMC